MGHGWKRKEKNKHIRRESPFKYVHLKDLERTELICGYKSSG
jgi:hypothetical protein